MQPASTYESVTRRILLKGEVGSCYIKIVILILSGILQE